MCSRQNTDKTEVASTSKDDTQSTNYESENPESNVIDEENKSLIDIMPSIEEKIEKIEKMIEELELLINENENTKSKNQTTSPNDNIIENLKEKLKLLKLMLEQNRNDLVNYTSFHKQIKSNDEEIAQFNMKIEDLKEKLNPIEGPIEKGNTTDIEDAIIQNSLAAVKYYYKQNPNCIQKDLENNLTPLLLASQKGYIDIIEFLVIKGADIDTVKKENSPLIEATKNGHSSILEFLLDFGANVNFQDCLLNTALHYAICSDNLSAIIFLTERGSDLSVPNNDLKTPLEYAMLNNSSSIRDYLSEYLLSL